MPLKLHALKGPDVFGGAGMARKLLSACNSGRHDTVRWIVITSHRVPEWGRAGEIRSEGVPSR